MKRKYLIRIEKKLHDEAKEILAPILVGKKDFSKIIEFLIQEKINKRKEKEINFTNDFTEFINGKQFANP